MKIMPIKIPGGFAVTYNKFFDVEPVQSEESKGGLQNWGYFTQDIMQIIKIGLKKGKWYIPSKDYMIIDLGWYPDGDPNGEYGLSLAIVREDNSWDTIKEFSSKNRFEVKDKIEEWMEENIKVYSP
ncbi:MAG: hypothetical protein GX272_12285 [Epulopiscium sp.]|jgi:hypothetical protein|nr:hypothetical protein [Candidatus Epulonipiscium sp.]